MRHILSGCAALVLLAFAASPARADDKAKRRLAHQVEQAILYVNMKLPDRAKEELTRLTESEPGKSDALTWLALSKTHYALRDLDEAGLALERAKGLKVEARLDEKKWARAYFDELGEMVGGVRIREATCENVKFRAKLAAPMVNREKRALLEALPGWRKKEFERRTDRPFFLPSGQFSLGETKVKIIPGEITSVTAKEIGAECTALPQVATGPTGGGGTNVAPPPPGGGVQTTQGGGFLADNWLWVVLGAVAVAGGTTAAVVVATQDSGPDRFRQVF